MKKNKGHGKSVKTPNDGTVRASISFPSHLYEALEELAKQKKVSLAWVVRDAAEKYVADRTADTTGRGNAT
jgi:metal-responsive CopG/Arc/MetJ family transcriptional regulator